MHYRRDPDMSPPQSSCDSDQIWEIERWLLTYDEGITASLPGEQTLLGPWPE